MISLPVSGIKSISLWTILTVSFVGGIFSGFLGGGAGYIRMPMMVYVLGVPTHLAVGTDLFEIIISASYGTFSHALKGNVDILIALVMQTGAAIGAQIGAICTQYFAGPKIRLAFVPLPLIGVGLVLYTLAYRTQTLASPCAFSFAATAPTPRTTQRGSGVSSPDPAIRRPRCWALPKAPDDEAPLRGALESEAALLGEQEIFPRIVVRSGEPIRQILAETTANEYDLAIIGARRKGEGGLYWRPEKTYEVIKAVPPPVLVAIGPCDSHPTHSGLHRRKKIYRRRRAVGGRNRQVHRRHRDPPSCYGGTARDLC